MKSIILFLMIGLQLSGETLHTSVSKSHFNDNNKTKCRWVCDKRVYREKEIAKAVDFYKKSSYYTFTKEP